MEILLSVKLNNVEITIITGLPLYLETWKNLKFDNLGKKKTGITWNFEQKS